MKKWMFLQSVIVSLGALALAILTYIKFKEDKYEITEYSQLLLELTALFCAVGFTMAITTFDYESNQQK